MLALRDGITGVGRAILPEGQMQAAPLAGLGARLRPGLARLLLVEVLADDPESARDRPAARGSRTGPRRSTRR